jgi:hypothetical protein
VTLYDICFRDYCPALRADPPSFGIRCPLAKPSEVLSKDGMTNNKTRTRDLRCSWQYIWSHKLNSVALVRERTIPTERPEYEVILPGYFVPKPLVHSPGCFPLNVWSRPFMVHRLPLVRSQPRWLWSVPYICSLVFSRGLFFYPEDEGSRKFHRNVSTFLALQASHPRRR